MTFDCGGSPSFPLVVHQTASSSIWSSAVIPGGGVCPQIHESQCGAYVGEVEEMVYVSVAKGE